ncbi:hypothetical protein RFI_07262, partial [Reticulomyxa filosa]
MFPKKSQNFFGKAGKIYLMASPPWDYNRRESGSASSNDSQTFLLNKKYFTTSQNVTSGAIPINRVGAPELPTFTEGLYSYPDKITEEAEEDISEEDASDETMTEEIVKLQRNYEPQSNKRSFSPTTREAFRPGYKQDEILLRNKVLCRGRVIGGPQTYKYIQTLLAITVPVV